MHAVEPGNSKISSSTGRPRRWRCRRLRIGRGDELGAVGCVLERNRRCTPADRSTLIHRASRLGAARPGVEVRDRGVPAVRPVRPSPHGPLPIATATALRNRPTAQTRRSSGRSRRWRVRSDRARTVGLCHGGVPGHRPDVPSSSDVDAHEAARTRHSRASCRSDRDRGRSPACSARRVRSRPRPDRRRRSHASGLAFQSPDTHPFSRVSLLSR